MAVAPDVHLFGKLDNVVSATAAISEPELGSIEIALCGYGSQIPHIPNEAMFGKITQPVGMTSSAQDLGTFSAYLYSNPLIQPPGTYYTVTVKDANGDTVQVNAYRFNSAGDFDLDSLQPYDPNLPPPPLPAPITNMLLLVGENAGAPNFDGGQYTAWKITLTQDIPGAYLTNIIPGNLYTFIIVQDAVGGHYFNWPSGPPPANLHNAAFVAMQPNATTIQTFIADEFEDLYAIGPGTYYP
jgi:hypothetical protein